MHNEYKRTCKESGHNIKVLTQMKANFHKRIGSPDAIIIFTSTVSHKMVQSAIKKAKKKNIPIIRSHTSSKSALKNIINKLEKKVSN
ncbi:hypothetical protein L21TH_1780 [Caldisalinibacter kiritimatiensis]|uniref:DUF2325 domain-containing protein n=2 Tax=Caldisalinibacter kiritimatiensis TaxID=1304284 RepID=R1CTW4_9FIRM|nr:hypothetical protein L21TH_1780 [Caldisalinibacter kiritimatiensis]